MILPRNHFSEYTYLFQWIHVLTLILTRKYFSEYTYLCWLVRHTHFYAYAHLSSALSWRLYKLQLKFVQTTAEVCTAFADVCRIGNAGFIFPLFIRKFQCVKTFMSIALWRLITGIGLLFKTHFPPIYTELPCGLPTIRYFSILAIIIPLHPDKSLYKDSKTFCTPLLAESSRFEQYICHNKHAYIPW